MPGTPEFLYEKKDHIAIMTFNRAEKRNSFTPEMIDALYECFDDFNEDPELYVAVFASTGDKAWCSGGDLDAMIPAITSGEFQINADPTKRVYSDIYKPIITAVNGFATLELILGADMCVASRNASFALGEVRWGMIPAGGSHVRLPRAIPWNVAMEVMLTGRPIDAQRAYEVGLVNRLVDEPADALPEAMRLAGAGLRERPAGRADLQGDLRARLGARARLRAGERALPAGAHLRGRAGGPALVHGEAQAQFTGR